MHITFWKHDFLMWIGQSFINCFFYANSFFYSIIPNSVLLVRKDVFLHRSIPGLGEVLVWDMGISLIHLDIFLTTLKPYFLCPQGNIQIFCGASTQVSSQREAWGYARCTSSCLTTKFLSCLSSTSSVVPLFMHMILLSAVIQE